MIVVRVELHSAITGRVTEIGRMHIANVGGTEDLGLYTATTLRGRSREQLDRRLPTRKGAVTGYPRKKLHVWHLVARALVAMGYAGPALKPEPADPFDAAEQGPAAP